MPQQMLSKCCIPMLFTLPLLQIPQTIIWKHCTNHYTDFLNLHQKVSPGSSPMNLLPMNLLKMKTSINSFNCL